MRYSEAAVVRLAGSIARAADDGLAVRTLEGGKKANRSTILDLGPKLANRPTDNTIEGVTDLPEVIEAASDAMPPPTACVLRTRH